MSSPGAVEVERAIAAMTAVLTPQVDMDWHAPAGDLDWSCWQTAAQVAHDLLAYACQLTARPSDAYLRQDLVVRPDASPVHVLQAVRASAGLLVLALRTAGPDVRAWHFGTTDPTGFAALALNEVLVHTWDITRGLGLDWELPQDLARQVVGRMWAQAPQGPPEQVLLWCTGRIALPGHPRVGDWVAPSPPPTGRNDQDW